MKKLLSILLCAVILLSFAVPATAASPFVVFTADSRFVEGGTVTVDKGKTLMNFYDRGTSDSYNAYLEGFAKYWWFCGNEYWGTGEKISFTSADVGKQFVLKVYLYNDAALTDYVGEFASETFTVEKAGGTSLKITTTELKDGSLGNAYYQKLECTDPDATFSLFRSSLPAGMDLTQHGEIEGTPTKAGLFYVVIMVKGSDGTEVTTEFELFISESPLNTIEITQLPNKLTYTAGEKLDMTGLRVRIYTPDGYMDLKDGDRLTYSDRALVTLGEQKIKLEYEDAFEFFIVTVVAAPEDPTVGTEATEATEATEPEQSGKRPTKGKGDKADKGNTAASAGEADGDAEGGISLQNVILVVLGVAVGIGGTVVVVLCVEKKRKK